MPESYPTISGRPIQSLIPLSPGKNRTSRGINCLPYELGAPITESMAAHGLDTGLEYGFFSLGQKYLLYSHVRWVKFLSDGNFIIEIELFVNATYSLAHLF